MQNEHFSFNIQQVHRLNLLIICALVAFIVTPIIIDNGFANSFLYILAGAGVILFSCLNYFLKIPYLLKALLFTVLPGTVIYALFFLDGFALNKHYFMLGTIVMAAIYFDRRVLIGYSGFIHFYYISLYILAPEKLLGDNHSLRIFLIEYFVLNGILFMLNH